MRYLVGGGINTALGYALYWLLLAWLPYPAAYTLSYTAGIVTGFAINTWFVFREPWSWRKLTAFPLIHVAGYAAGLAVTMVSVRALGIAEKWAALVATATVFPLTFLLTRALIKSRNAG